MGAALRRFLKGCIVAAACRSLIGPRTAHRLLAGLGLVHV